MGKGEIMQDKRFIGDYVVYQRETDDDYNKTGGYFPIAIVFTETMAQDMVRDFENMRFYKKCNILIEDLTEYEK